MKFLKNNQGFSMVEVLVSLVVLSVGLIGTGKYQIALLKNSSDVQARSQAINIAQKKIEEIKSYENLSAFGDIKSSDTLIAEATSAGTTLDFSTTGVSTTYDLGWTVLQNTNPGYVEIEVVVAWNEANGAPKQVKINSIVSQSDPNDSGRLASSSF